jgi:hypothetical protein
MNLYYNQTNKYKEKYLKYKKKYVDLKEIKENMKIKQMGGNIDKLCVIMPMFKEFIISLERKCPKFFQSYVELKYRNIIFIDGDEILFNINYKLFNVLNLNYETFIDFYTTSLYENKLSNFLKIRIIKTFFKNNPILNEHNLEINSLIIVTIIDNSKIMKKYHFHIEVVHTEKFTLIIVLLPKTNILREITNIFFTNQFLYLNQDIKFIESREEYTLFSFTKIYELNEKIEQFIKIGSVFFEINLIDWIYPSDSTITTSSDFGSELKYRFTKFIKTSSSLFEEDIIYLKYREQKVKYSNNLLLNFLLIELVKKNSTIFNIEKYVKIKQITRLRLKLVEGEYLLRGDINNNYVNNYLNDYLTQEKSTVYLEKNYLSLSNENNRFFYQYNSVKNFLIEKYQNMKNFNASIFFPTKTYTNLSNSNIYKNIIKDGTNTFNFIYKLKKKTDSKIINNIFYDYCCSRCVNKFKSYFPNFVHTFYYFVYQDFKDEYLIYEDNEVNFYDKIIKIIDTTKVDEQFKQDLYLNCRYVEMSYTEDDYSGIAIEEITDGISIINLIEMHLKEFTIRELRKLKTNDMFDYVLWSYFIQIYSTLNSLKNNFTHYDLHLDNIIYKPVPNNMYVKIIYYSKSLEKSVNEIEFSLYSKYIPVIIDYGKANFSCINLSSDMDTLPSIDLLNGELCTQKIADILCQENELNKCTTSGKTNCELGNMGINYSEISDKPDNIKNSNISQDLRYFALAMETIIETMKENNISKTNLHIYKDLKKYELSGWFKKETKYLFFNKVKPQINKYVVSPESTQKGKISNVESFYKYLLSFYETRIKKILPKFEENFKSRLYGTIHIDMSKNNFWKFIPA